MDLGLADKVAYVSGSSRGIGLGIARAFLSEGARVVVTGRDPCSLKAAEEDLTRAHGADRVLALCGDLEDVGFSALTVEQTLGRWNRLDCVVCNLGAGTDGTGGDIAAAEWRRAFSVNFWSGQILAQQAIPSLVKTGSGSLVFIASLAGAEEIGAPAPYTVAKSAVIALAKSLSRTLARDGVRVNAVAPGNVLHPGGRWEARLAARRDETLSMIRREVPLGRFGTPDEIADAVVFLASQRAAFITGACLLVDGGQSHAL
jgi:3-oxoacyl-[acyl-carrier protein] reductase